MYDDYDDDEHDAWEFNHGPTGSFDSRWHQAKGLVSPNDSDEYFAHFLQRLGVPDDAVLTCPSGGSRRASPKHGFALRVCGSDDDPIFLVVKDRMPVAAAYFSYRGGMWQADLYAPALGGGKYAANFSLRGPDDRTARECDDDAEDNIAKRVFDAAQKRARRRRVG